MGHWFQEEWIWGLSRKKMRPDSLWYFCRPKKGCIGRPFRVDDDGYVRGHGMLYEGLFFLPAMYIVPTFSYLQAPFLSFLAAHYTISVNLWEHLQKAVASTSVSGPPAKNFRASGQNCSDVAPNMHTRQPKICSDGTQPLANFDQDLFRL